jgi:hypothetical protein
MTVNELAIEMLRAQNEAQDDTDFILTVEQWIRDALDELALYTDWRAFQTSDTITTIISQRVYTLAINVRDIRFIRDPVSDIKVSYETKARLVDLGLDLEKPGRPDFYYPESVSVSAPNVKYTIGFQPIPNAVYNFDVGYNIVPQRLLSMDTIPIQNEMILPLKNLTRSMMAFDDTDYDLADRLYARFVDQTDKLMRRENSKADDNPRLQQRDIPSRGRDRRLAHLDPNHFS